MRRQRRKCATLRHTLQDPHRSSFRDRGRGYAYALRLEDMLEDRERRARATAHGAVGASSLTLSLYCAPYYDARYGYST